MNKLKAKANKYDWKKTAKKIGYTTAYILVSGAIVYLTSNPTWMFSVPNNGYGAISVPGKQIRARIDMYSSGGFCPKIYHYGVSVA